MAYGGAYAEYIAVSVKMIVHKPNEMSWITAAGVPEVWFTAIQAAFLVGNLSKGQTVLFHAGASGTPPLPHSLPSTPFHPLPGDHGLTGSGFTMFNSTCGSRGSKMYSRYRRFR